MEGLTDFKAFSLPCPPQLAVLDYSSVAGSHTLEVKVPLLESSDVLKAPPSVELNSSLPIFSAGPCAAST